MKTDLSQKAKARILDVFKITTPDWSRHKERCEKQYQKVLTAEFKTKYFDDYNEKLTVTKSQLQCRRRDMSDELALAAEIRSWDCPQKFKREIDDVCITMEGSIALMDEEIKALAKEAEELKSIDVERKYQECIAFWEKESQREYNPTVAGEQGRADYLEICELLDETPEK